jgi:hypothetical protein
MSYIGRMRPRPDIIMLQNARTIEIMHITLSLIPLVHTVNLIDEIRSLPPRIPILGKRAPKAHDDNLRTGIDGVHLGDKVHVGLEVLLRGDGIVGVAVVGADVDEDDVGGLVGRKVPEGRIGAVDLLRAGRRVGDAVPLVFLAAWVVPADGVVETDAWVGGDAKLGVAKAGADVVTEAGEGFVRGRVAACQTVADEFDVAGVVWDFDECGVGGEVDGGDLHAVGPVCHAEFKGEGELGGEGCVEIRSGRGDEVVGCVGGYVG